ncbi:MAG: hypothetical protein ACFCUR_02680 [Rhodomicrobiaceae bacterium]
MNPREMFANLKAIFPTLLIAIVVLAGAAAAIWYLPNRTAAVILGIVAAIALVRFVLQGLQRITQIAIFWLSVGVVADAAYAKLNDVAPVTIASLVVKFMEAAVKLLDILIRSIGIGGPNIRADIAAVTPDFTWALILSATLLMAISLMGRQRGTYSAAKPDLRRAA